MERNFMGVVVKQETPDETIDDAAPVRSSAMQWSFSDKSSAVPQVVKEEKLNASLDSLALTELVSVTMKNTIPEVQRGVRYPVTIHPLKHLDFHPSHLPVTSMTNPVPATMSSNSPVVGTTDSRNVAKISTALAQLTIFYNGSVCVYDNISSEKAQAIMLLAGNAPPMTSSAMPHATPVQATTPMPSALGGFVANQPYGTTPYFSSPVPITSVSISHSAGTKNDTSAVKPTGNLVSSPNQAEPLKVVNPIGPVSATFLSAGSVPQFRRKSLARFLEKRKERVLSTSPYPDMQSPECSNLGAGSKSLSVNSSGSCPVPVVN